jgi:hypothetical protein
MRRTGALQVRIINWGRRRSSARVSSPAFGGRGMTFGMMLGMMLHQPFDELKRLAAWVAWRPAGARSDPGSSLVPRTLRRAPFLRLFLVAEEDTASTFRALEEVFGQHRPPLEGSLRIGQPLFFTAGGRPTA